MAATFFTLLLVWQDAEYGNFHFRQVAAAIRSVIPAGHVGGGDDLFHLKVFVAKYRNPILIADEAVYVLGCVDVRSLRWTGDAACGVEEADDGIAWATGGTSDWNL